MVDGAVQSNSVVRRRPAATAVGLLALGLLLGLIALWAAPSALAAPGDKVFALTAKDRLVSFDKDAPRQVLSSVTVGGLAEGESLVGVDFRPANGKLYGIGDTNQVYTINTRSGQANPVGAPFATPLVGDKFGVDFNPTVDRIRVVSDADQNLRLNPDDGTVAAVDPNLQYAATDENAGEDPNVTAAAYTNNRASAFGTTDTALYDIDTGLDILTTQNPANNGTLNTVGPLGIDAAGLAGFDTAPGYGALAALRQEGQRSRLYEMNLDTGRAVDQGRIGARMNVEDIAIPLPKPADAN